MAMRSFIKRSVLAGRTALEHRRRFTNLEIREYNKDSGRNFRSMLHRFPYADHKDEETVNCGKFCDEDTVNAEKFAEDCVVSSYKFADEDTINAEKLADEGAIGCAKFAIDEIALTKKMNIELVWVVRSSRIPTWSRDYQLILEAVNKDDGAKSLYYAEVQSQLWMEKKPFKLVTWMAE